MQRMGAILILDNDRAIVELIAEVLSDEGYLVRTSFDGSSSRTSIAAPPLALILLDSAMSAIGVATALEYGHSRPSDVPVVLTTTSPSIAGAMSRAAALNV
jgi:DNA-binding NtrC family response regulator